MGSGSSRIHSGFRILNVLPSGAAATTLVFPDPSSARSPSRRTPRRSALVPWLDFIISINGYNLNEMENSEAAFASEIMTAQQDNDHGNTVILEIFNIKRNAVRTVQITLPSSSTTNLSPASASVSTTTTSTADAPSPPVLGAVITWEPIPDLGGIMNGNSTSTEIPLHVTEVETNSIAEKAGLVVDQDYLLGCTINNITYGFTDNESFGNAVYDSRGQDLLLYVYNITNDTVRLVELPVPDDGKGLGIGLSSGSFHQLPLFARETDGVNILDLSDSVTHNVSSPMFPSSSSSSSSSSTSGVTVLPFEHFIAHETKNTAIATVPTNTAATVPSSEPSTSTVPADTLSISSSSSSSVSVVNIPPANSTLPSVPSHTLPSSSPAISSNTHQHPMVIPPTNIIPTVVPPPVVKFLPSSSSLSTNPNISSSIGSGLTGSITPFGSSQETKKEGPGALSLSLLSHLPPPRTLPVNESPVKEETIEWSRYE